MIQTSDFSNGYPKHQKSERDETSVCVKKEREQNVSQEAQNSYEGARGKHELAL